MTFTELKAYFEKVDLPKEMRNEFLYFSDVRFTVDLHISRIESEIERLGKNVKNSAIATASKARLIEIKNILETSH